MEEVVRGRALDRYATLASRETISSLKSKSVIESFNSNGRLTFKLKIPEITTKVGYLRDIIISVQEGNDVKSSGSYEFDLDADEDQRKESDILASLILPRRYNEDFSFISQLIPELKETFRHELEHSSQSTEDLMSVQRVVPDQDIWKDIETAENYYLSDAETQAHIAGIYKKAKSFKKPSTSILRKVLVGIYNTGLRYHLDPKKLTNLLDKIEERWTNYLFKRYPRAQ